MKLIKHLKGGLTNVQLTEAIRKRKSIRSFEKDKVSVQELNDILEAGTFAPSAKNRQPWFFYIINDEYTQKTFIQQLNAGMQKLLQKYAHSNIQRPDIKNAFSSLKSMEQASVIILVSCQKKYSKVFEDNVKWDLHALDIEVTDILSIGAAIQNILLKATELGYGTLWICDIFYAYPQLVDFLQTKEAIVSAVCLGKPAECPLKRTRLPLNAVSTFIKKEKK